MSGAAHMNTAAAVTITTWHLEMCDPAWLRCSSRGSNYLDVRRVEIPSPAMNRFLYETVGSNWGWTDKLRWTDDKWAAWVGRDDLETWVGYLRGAIIGYFELERQPGE